MTELTDTELNRRLAVALGWTNLHVSAHSDTIYGTPPGPKIRGIATVPNYAGDLNACHEVENQLYPEGMGWGDYYEALCDVTHDDMPARATARQRALALLATLEAKEGPVLTAEDLPAVQAEAQMWADAAKRAKEQRNRECF